MGRKPRIQDRFEIKSITNCCDEIVTYHYNFSMKRWESICPKCQLNLWIEITTPSIRYKSNDFSKIKECSNCGRKWMNSHTCNSPDFASIIESMKRPDNTLMVHDN